MTDFEAKLLTTLLHVALILYLFFSLINNVESHRYDFLIKDQPKTDKWIGTPYHQYLAVFFFFLPVLWVFDGISL